MPSSYRELGEEFGDRLPLSWPLRCTEEESLTMEAISASWPAEDVTLLRVYPLYS